MNESVKVQCPKCGGPALVSAGAGTVLEHYRCTVCGEETAIRVHYSLETVAINPQCFKGMVHIADPSDLVLVRASRARTVQLFADWISFDERELDRQIQQGRSVWDLGFYAESDISDLMVSAKALELDLKFVLDE